MHDDEILLTDGFTLLDSMSAIEVGSSTTNERVSGGRT